MDTQTLELVGQHRLASELLQAGLEVAFPARDRGVDLIAYLDVDPESDRFVAKPIQLKSASRRSFGVWKKYGKFHDLILAYVWHLDGQQPAETYALSQPEALAVGQEMGYLETVSWKEGGGYGTTRPSARLIELLKPYRMSAKKWRDKVIGAHQEPLLK